MKENINKFLSKTMLTYTFLLVIIFILKLVGLDYFGLDTSNSVIREIDEVLSEYKLDYIYQIACLYLNFYLLNSIMFKTRNFSLKIFAVPTIIVIFTIILIYSDKLEYYSLMNTTILLVYFLIKKVGFKRIIYVFAINIIFQFINLYVRNYNPQGYEIVANAIMNVDYYIMLLIWYKLETQGGDIKCQEVYSSSQKKIHLRKLLKQLQRNLDNFKKKPRQEKIELFIYIILSLLWNTLSLILILIVAKLNNTFIECIFILTSFWLSKTTFGKPFHLQSMAKCFVVSNLTYYALNRITTPLGISIIIPIIIGVGLSYITSKFVKKTVAKLYKGMPEDEFDNNILRVIDKNSLQYKICHMFYVDRKSELEIAHNVGYSIDNIKKIKAKINKKIKELS